MNQYIPEIGQSVFGQQYKEYDVDRYVEACLRMIREELDRIMWNINQKEMPSPFDNTGARWKCDEFEVEAYSWDEDYNQPYNFKWKDIEISWYKYMNRGMSCNQELTPDKASKMLNACLKALLKYEKENDLDEEMKSYE